MSVGKIPVRSVTYVHDPKAGQKWFDIFVELLEEELERAENKRREEEWRKEDLRSD